MKLRHGRRAAALMLAGVVGLGSMIVVANAETSLEAALSSKRTINERIDEIHQARRHKRIAIHRKLRSSEHRLETVTSMRSIRIGQDRGFRRWRKQQLKQIKELRTLEREVSKTTLERIMALRGWRSDLVDWIVALPLQRCPVDGIVEVADNFGDIREMPGTPRHIHQGNDMMAATGTPIVAPFDGTSVAEPGELGGEAVKVYGDAGYVYNAHLSAYGKLGEVQAGDVIGYVGSTGNATAPHDHFEWHPYDGPAVDPYELLMTVC